MKLVSPKPAEATKLILTCIIAAVAFGAVFAWLEHRQSSSSGPVAEIALIDAPAHIYSHDAYLDAIEWIESKGYPWAEGDLKDGVYRAIGAYQLWKIYVDDFNRIQELHGDTHRATYRDRENRVESRKITSVVTAYYANHDWRDKPHTQLQWIETAVRAHKCPPERNKESTKAYWEKVKAVMEIE